MVRRARVTDRNKDFIDHVSAEWAALYNSRGYAIGDPVFLWCLLNVGTKRWSEIRIKDHRGVLKKAKTFGLNYGAVVSLSDQGHHSILSICHSEREFSDTELALCARYLDEALLEMDAKGPLKSQEIEVLKHLSEGQTLEATAVLTGAAISTVKNRLSRARTALDAKTATQAVAEAMRRKLL